MKDFVFIDIDTQKDLVEHFGARAIPDCPEIRENLMELMSFAMRNSIPILSPVSVETKNWEKILDAECERFKIVEDDVEWGDAQQLIFEHPDTSPFSNKLLMKALNELAPKTIVVYGVPLETSVKAVVQELSEKTDYKIWLVRDVVKGYEEEEETLQELRKLKNVSLMSARNVIKFLSEMVFTQNSPHE